MSFHWLQVLKNKIEHAMSSVEADLTNKKAELKDKFNDEHEEEAKSRAASALMNIAGSVDASAIPTKQAADDTTATTTDTTTGESTTDNQTGSK